MKLTIRFLVVDTYNSIKKDLKRCEVLFEKSKLKLKDLESIKFQTDQSLNLFTSYPEYAEYLHSLLLEYQDSTMFKSYNFKFDDSTLKKLIP